jgi:ribonuclease BN (tRNA processing enzyme)
MMKIKLIPSSLSASGQEQFLTSFLVGETISIDAGALGYSASLSEQRQVCHVLLSHTHADHLASLPIFVENTLFSASDCVVTIYGQATVLASLRRDVFNDRIWPDYVRLAYERGELLRFAELEPEVPVELDGVKITPVEVNHAVPTFGFLLESASSAAIVATDTGPTERLWELANQTPDLKLVFLDASFPESMRDMAEVSGHLTPQLFAREMRKVERPVRFVAVHIKAAFRKQVSAEILALQLSDLEIGVSGKPYEL